MEKLSGLGHLFMTIFLHTFSSFMVIPAITDVTMAAICPGQEECSLAIYLSGFQHAIIGVGTLVMMPLVGNLSDKYGRKALLTVPLTFTIIPLVILAYSRTRNYYYAYYVLKILTAMFCEGSVQCLALAYVADNVSVEGRASAFGILSGIGSCAFVCGTLSARFLSTASTFQVATAVAIVAAVYMRVFLRDSIVADDLSAPLMSERTGKVHDVCSDGKSVKKDLEVFKTMPSLEDMICLLKTSVTFSQAAVVMFFNNLADVGLHASLLYYLKARFHFNKDQFADLMVISGIASTISQLFLMPMLAPILGEEMLLSIGLFFNCVHMLLFGIAWSSWVSYAAAMFSILFIFSQPCVTLLLTFVLLCCFQGKAQGCISGIGSFANVVSPLAFSPLTALFLSEKAPFNFPGFSLMCCGFVSMVAFIQSIMIRAAPPISNHKSNTCNYVDA
ncbi:hippocampus abundant transcript-like protein 1 isoform X2 [Tripterygium wilfordii]|uniref:Hippocampus abundant transcript-like protein 1 isoform X2 n=1 Tax=Tripterygium wilfordii TaxID=458696 RepID=A0A7J7D3H1_TRIWF|nr:hippocampus abundant transcript-like protein 1 isoform X2 [Tripterygium wilfordii]